MKSQTLRARVEPDFAELVQKVAVERGQTMSEVVRDVLGSGFQQRFAQARESVTKASTRHAGQHHEAFGQMVAHFQSLGHDVESARNLAAYVGAKKYGHKLMSEAAAHHRSVPAEQRAGRRQDG